MASCIKVIFLLAQILFAALGAVLIGVGAWVWYMVGSVIAWMPIVVVFSGAIILVLNVIGICGAGYDKTTPNEHKFKKALMIIYFFVFFVIDLTIAVASTLCIVAYDKVKSIVLANLPALIEIAKKNWPSVTGKYDVDYISDKVISNLKVVGGIGIAIACVFVLGLLLSGIILGYQPVFTHTLTFGNIVLAVAGAFLIALGFFVYNTGVIDGKAIPLVIGLLGIAIIVLAVVGFVSACCHEKGCARCFLCLYAVILCVLLVACIVLGIVAAAASDTMARALDQVCDVEAVYTSVCEPVFKLICDPTMNCTLNATSTAVVIETLKSYVKGNLYMVAAAAIWIGVVMAYLIVAACIVRCIPVADKDAAKKEEIPAGTPLPTAGATPTNPNTF